MLAISISAFLFVGISALRQVWLNPKQSHIIYFLSVLAIYTAPHTIVYGTSRYHMPLMPILIILAVPGLMELYGYVFSKYKLQADLPGSL